MKCVKGFLCELYNLSYESSNYKYVMYNFLVGVGERIRNKYLNNILKKDSCSSNGFDDFMDLFDIRIFYKKRMWIFLSRTRRKLLIRFSGGGVFFIYIYPNEPFIESLQLMFDHEEKEELFGKWGFMIR